MIRFTLPLLLFLLSGCAGLQLTLKNASVQKPSNVALYFSVETKNNLPVPGLDADMFHIYEDGQLISPYESKQTILNPEVSVAHFTVLLMDLSGSITESGTLPSLIEAASLFADRITKNQQIAVYGFDGGAKLIPVVAPTSDAAVVRKGLKALENYKVRDPSTNLNGAVVEAVHVLQGLMDHAKQPMRFGTLVLFTDGTDRAHRVSDADMFETLHNADLNVFAIGMGGEISPRELQRLSTVGYLQADDLEQIGFAFDDVAELIEETSRKFYLLSYCSPSRAGHHTLEIEAFDEKLSGRLEHEFDATGFGPGCDPGQKPTFKAARVTTGKFAKSEKSGDLSTATASTKKSASLNE
ncbi:MAG TPA: VWA domain-containing protein [Fibrobacteraceae bacterium]|nr:VWA domain-containing protein [Fibrobacteraceae bacterium]